MFRASGATQGRTTIRRPHRAPPPTKDGPRVNREIRIPQVQLIDHEGVNHGIVDTQEAMDRAQDAGLDLVEISPNSRPPVTKILDYGRFKYDAQKKAAEARKKQKNTELKEVKMRPNIDIHDYQVKTRAMRRFFEDGDKVKVTLRFRGREMAHQDLGLKVLNRVRDDFAEETKVEQMPRLEGRLMVMVMAPIPGKMKPSKRNAAQEAEDEARNAEIDSADDGDTDDVENESATASA